MALPTSGTIRISNIRDEFGGTGARALSSYKRGGGLVPNHEQNANIPTTNSNIALSKFYGTSKNFEITMTGSGSISTSNAIGYTGPGGAVSVSGTQIGKFPSNLTTVIFAQFFDFYSTTVVAITPITIYEFSVFSVSGNNTGTWWSSIEFRGITWQRTVFDNPNGVYVSSIDQTRWSFGRPEENFQPVFHPQTFNYSNQPWKLNIT